MKKFKFTTEIPEWFDLGNYKDVNKLTAQQWRKHLECRFCLINLVTTDSRKNESCSIDFDLLDNIRATGMPNSIYDLYDYSTSRAFDNSRAHYFPEIKNYAVRPLTMIEIACAGEDLLEPLMEGKIKVPDIYSNDMLSMPFDIYMNKHSDDRNRDTFAYLAIDLMLPISDIVSELKKFIPEYRKLLDIIPITLIPSESTIGKLASYKILPYLDLYIWELEKKLKIKRSRYAGALFPDHMYGEVDLDQIVKPFAMKAIELSFSKHVR